jgi:L-threonylcarbamoyladenylate synthase
MHNFSDIFAYPTEAVWGLGCDPHDAAAVQTIYDLKQRPESKGMIILVKDWEQVESLVDPTAAINWEPIRASWPGPVTWVFPVSKQVPDYLQTRGTIALRMPSYPFLQQLLVEFDKPLISTSANVSGEPAAKTAADVNAHFPGVTVINGECEGRDKPSAVYDAVTGACLRKS